MTTASWQAWAKHWLISRAHHRSQAAEARRQRTLGLSSQSPRAPVGFVYCPAPRLFNVEAEPDWRG